MVRWYRCGLYKMNMMRFELVHINIGLLSVPMLYQAGQIVSRVLGEKNVLILSGDLSHRLTHDAPAGFDEMGQGYDDKIVEAVKTGAIENILTLDETLVERAGQCAQKPLEFLTGCFDGYRVKTKIFSYEGPFGVGYMTARIERGEKVEESRINQYIDQRNKEMRESRKSADDYVRLARETIEAYVTHEIRPPVPKGLDEVLYQEKKGVFVSIKKNGRLRGCIGTIEPVRSCIAEEIIENAVCHRDPRPAVSCDYD